MPPKPNLNDANTISRVTVIDMPTTFTTPIIATSHDIAARSKPAAAAVDFLRAFVGYNSAPGNTGSVYFVGDPSATAFPHFSYLSFPVSRAAAIRSRDGSQDHLLTGWVQSMIEMSPPLHPDTFQEAVLDLGTPRLLAVAVRHLLGQLPDDPNDRRDLIIVPDHVAARYLPDDHYRAVRNQPQPPDARQQPYRIDVPWLTDPMLQVSDDVPSNLQAPHLTDITTDGLLGVRTQTLPGIVPISRDALYISRSAALLSDLLLAFSETPNPVPVSYLRPSNTRFRGSGRSGFSVDEFAQTVRKVAGKLPDRYIEVFYYTLEATADDTRADWIVTPSIMCLDPKLSLLPEFHHFTPFIADTHSITSDDSFRQILAEELDSLRLADPTIHARITNSYGYDAMNPFVIAFDHDNIRLRPIDMMERLPDNTTVFREFNWPLDAAQTHRGALKLALMISTMNDAPYVVPHDISSIESERRFQLGGEAMSSTPNWNPDYGAEPAAITETDIPNGVDPSAVEEAAITPGRRAIRDVPDDFDPVDDAAEAAVPAQNDGAVNAEIIETKNSNGSASTGRIAARRRRKDAASDQRDTTSGTNPRTNVAASSVTNDAAPNTVKDAASSPQTSSADTYDSADTQDDARRASQMSAPVRWIAAIRDRLTEIAAKATGTPKTAIRVLEDAESVMLDHMVSHLRVKDAPEDADEDAIKAAMPDPQTTMKIATEIADGTYFASDYLPDDSAAESGTGHNSPGSANDQKNTAQGNDDAGGDDDLVPPTVSNQPVSQHAEGTAPDMDDDDTAEDGDSDAVAQIASAADDEDDLVPPSTSSASHTAPEDNGADGDLSVPDQTVSKPAEDTAPDMDQIGTGKTEGAGATSGPREIIQDEVGGALVQEIRDNRHTAFSGMTALADTMLTPPPDTPEPSLSALQRQFVSKIAHIAQPATGVRDLDAETYRVWFTTLLDGWTAFVESRSDPRLELAEATFQLSGVAPQIAMNSLPGAKSTINATHREIIKAKNKLTDVDWPNVLDTILRSTGIDLAMLADRGGALKTDDISLIEGWQRLIGERIVPLNAEPKLTKFNKERRIAAVMSWLIRLLMEQRENADAPLELGHEVPFDLLPHNWPLMSLADLQLAALGKADTGTVSGGKTGGAQDGSGTGGTDAQSHPGSRSAPPEPVISLSGSDLAQAQQTFRLQSQPHWAAFGIPTSGGADNLDHRDQASIRALVAQFHDFGITNHNASRVGLTAMNYWIEAMGTGDFQMTGEIFERALRYAISHITNRGNLLAATLKTGDVRGVDR